MSEQNEARILETERTYLRELTADDFSNLCTVLQDPEAMYAYEHAFSDTEVSHWLNVQRERYKKDGFGLYAVCKKSDGMFIGQAGLTVQSVGGGRQAVEIGYLFRRRFWHHGYATECAKALKFYAFEVLGLSEVVSVIRVENTASRRVAERNGMTPEETVVKHYYEMEMPHIVYRVRRTETEPF